MVADKQKAIQDYLDGRMSAKQRSAFAAQLRDDRALADKVQELQAQDDMLRSLGEDILAEPVPGRLAEIVRQARRPTERPVPEEFQNDVERLAATAAHGEARAWRKGILQAGGAVGIVACGLAIGWIGREAFVSPYDDNTLALLSARDAFRQHRSDRDYPMEFPVERAGEMADWLEKANHRPVRPPKLDDVGYRFIGGRLLNSRRSRLGFYLFEGKADERVAVMIWPSEKPVPSRVRKLLSDDSTESRIFWGDGLSFAVIGENGSPNLALIEDKVRKFYLTRQ